MAMDSWKVREGLSDKIGRGMYVLAEYEKIKRLTMPFGAMCPPTLFNYRGRSGSFKHI
jgi:hypothetical protein